MRKLHRLILFLVYPILRREIHRIGYEKEAYDNSDAHHINGDCGFQLLEEIKPEEGEGWKE